MLFINFFADDLLSNTFYFHVKFAKFFDGQFANENIIPWFLVKTNARMATSPSNSTTYSPETLRKRSVVYLDFFAVCN